MIPDYAPPPPPARGPKPYQVILWTVAGLTLLFPFLIVWRLQGFPSEPLLTLLCFAACPAAGVFVWWRAKCDGVPSELTVSLAIATTVTLLIWFSCTSTFKSDPGHPKSAWRYENTIQFLNVLPMLLLTIGLGWLAQRRSKRREWPPHWMAVAILRA